MILLKELLLFLQNSAPCLNRLKQKGLNARQAQSILKHLMRCFYLLLRKGCGFSTSCNLISLYNESILFRLTGKLNRVAQSRASTKSSGVMKSCARFQVVEGQPVQIIAPTLTLTLPVVDLQEIRSIEQETKVKQVATRHPFDLS